MSKFRQILLYCLASQVFKIYSFQDLLGLQKVLNCFSPCANHVMQYKSQGDIHNPTMTPLVVSYVFRIGTAFHQLKIPFTLRSPCFVHVSVGFQPQYGWYEHKLTYWEISKFKPKKYEWVIGQQYTQGIFASHTGTYAVLFYYSWRECEDFKTWAKAISLYKPSVVKILVEVFHKGQLPERQINSWKIWLDYCIFLKKDVYLKHKKYNYASLLKRVSFLQKWSFTTCSKFEIFSEDYSYSFEDTFKRHARVVSF